MTTALVDLRVLIVDDNAINVELVEQILKRAGYTDVVSTRDSEAVEGLCRAWEPDLVLLDLHMPKLSGYDVLEAINDLILEPSFLPVLVLTADATTAARHRALSLGARDFVIKPVDQTELLLRVHNLLHARMLHRQLQNRNAFLDRAVQVRTAELEGARRESLAVLAAIGEFHDDDTHEHTQRVGIAAAALAATLELPAPFCAELRHAAPLHDIGKVGISRTILRKPGPLTDEEFAIMRRHPDIGARILGSAQSPVLRLAAVVARTHHERWDGRGYPSGIAGESIPMAGRITAVADVFDALTHERPYKAAWPIEEARALILDGAGSQFDPSVVAAFTTLDAAALARGDVDPAAPLAIQADVLNPAA